MAQPDRMYHDTEQAVRRFLALIADRYGTAQAIVYGSRARGTHRPDSDADVAFDILLETGILVSPLPIWLDEWEAGLPNPAFSATPAPCRAGFLPSAIDSIIFG